MDRLPFYQRPLKYSSFNATLVLVGINVLLFFAQMIAPAIRAYLALTPAAVLELNWWWQPFSYMFTHFGSWHLLFNMIGLLLFGMQLERRIGSGEFLLFYLVVGTLAGVFSLFFYALAGAYNIPLVGASGAIFGVLLAFATYYPTATILVFGIIPVRAPVLVIGFTALEVFSIITGNRGNVAHLTHLAGFLFAFLYLVIRLRINPIREFRDSSRY